MTGTDLYKRTHKSVPVIFEPPCIILTAGEEWLRMTRCILTGFK